MNRTMPVKSSVLHESREILRSMLSLIKKIIGTKNDREIKRIRPYGRRDQPAWKIELKD